jgi:hypothetical protein
MINYGIQDVITDAQIIHAYENTQTVNNQKIHIQNG